MSIERFEEIFAAHHDALMRYALRRVAVDDAADVVAETFAVALRRWSTGVPPAEPLPWLYAVAHNVVRNHRRRNARSSTGLPDGWLPTHEQPTHERLSMLTALAALAPADQEVLMLTALEGLDTRQLADTLGCSQVAARVRLHRARQRLLAAIDPQPASPEEVHP